MAPRSIGRDTTEMPENSEKEVVKINGWWSQFDDSVIIHAVPRPTDLGGHGKALCGHSAARGWVESARPESYRCSPCITQIERLYDADELDPYDRKEYRYLVRQSQTQI